MFISYLAFMLAFLFIGTVFTSIISGVIGMGGGVLLLSILSFFLPYELLIPIHGLIQLISNFSRSFYLRKHIKWNFFIPFLIGAPFGVVLVYFVIKNITAPNFYYLLLALFITYVVFKPKRMPSFILSSKQWGVLGFFSAIQGSLIGATGPLIAPFYLRDDISKEEVVATKAAQQIVTHALKIPLFLSLSFSYIPHLEMIVLLSLAAVFGTFLGVKILGKVNEKTFKKVFKVMLIFAAARLYYKFWIGL